MSKPKTKPTQADKDKAAVLRFLRGIDACEESVRRFRTQRGTLRQIWAKTDVDEMKCLLVRLYAYTTYTRATAAANQYAHARAGSYANHGRWSKRYQMLIRRRLVTQFPATKVLAAMRRQLARWDRRGLGLR